MNYLKEINLFYGQQELDDLSPSAISLWHALMFINSRKGWPETFSVPLQVLQSKSGLTKRSLCKARTELTELDYITVQSRKGRQSAVYQLHSFTKQAETPQQDMPSNVTHLNSSIIDSNLHHKQTTEKPPTTSSQQTTITKKTQNTNHNKAHKVDHNRAPCSIQKTKQKEKKNLLCTYYNQYLKRTPSQNELQHLHQYVHTHSFEMKLLAYALKLTGDRHKPFSYTKGILSNWHKQGITTYDAAMQHQENYYSNKGGDKHEFSHGRNEERPEQTSHIKFYR